MVTSMVVKRKFGGKEYVTWHGSPFDRGSADSWFGKARDPHWYPKGTFVGERIPVERMTDDQIEAYHAGYDENEQFGSKEGYNNE